jgi:hypothetical protein
MKAKWLLEKDLFDTESEMINAIINNGYEYKLISFSNNDDISKIINKFNADDCVVYYGSIGLAKKIKRNASWIPGVYLNELAFECTSYYPNFGNELLHNNYIMLPFGDLIRQKDFIFKQFNCDEIFLRPNSGTKNFTGTVLNYDNFNDGVNLAGFYGIEPNLLCIVSNAKKLKKEWRFVIADQNVVSGSLYRDWTIGGDYSESETKDIVLLKSKQIEEYCIDNDVYDYVNRVAKLYEPDKCWTIDIALCDNNDFKVLEIGSFSCAGLYANDMNKVVCAVSNSAENEYNEYTI